MTQNHYQSSISPSQVVQQHQHHPIPQNGKGNENIFSGQNLNGSSNNNKIIDDNISSTTNFDLAYHQEPMQSSQHHLQQQQQYEVYTSSTIAEGQVFASMQQHQQYDANLYEQTQEQYQHHQEYIDASSPILRNHQNNLETFSHRHQEVEIEEQKQQPQQQIQSSNHLSPNTTSAKTFPQAHQGGKVYKQDNILNNNNQVSSKTIVSSEIIGCVQNLNNSSFLNDSQTASDSQLARKATAMAQASLTPQLEEYQECHPALHMPPGSQVVGIEQQQQQQKSNLQHQSQVRQPILTYPQFFMPTQPPPKSPPTEMKDYQAAAAQATAVAHSQNLNLPEHQQKNPQPSYENQPEGLISEPQQAEPVQGGNYPQNQIPSSNVYYGRLAPPPGINQPLQYIVEKLGQLRARQSEVNTKFQQFYDLRATQGNVAQHLPMYTNQFQTPAMPDLPRIDPPPPSNPPQQASSPIESNNAKNNIRNPQQMQHRNQQKGLQQVVTFIDNFAHYISQIPYLDNAKNILNNFCKQTEQVKAENAKVYEQLQNAHYAHQQELKRKQEFIRQLQQRNNQLRQQSDRFSQQIVQLQQKFKDLHRENLQKRIAEVNLEKQDLKKQLNDFKSYHTSTLKNFISQNEGKIKGYTEKLEQSDELIDKLNQDIQSLQLLQSQKAAQIQKQINLLKVVDDANNQNLINQIKEGLTLIEEPAKMRYFQESRGGCLNCEDYQKQLVGKEEQIERLNQYIKSRTVQESRNNSDPILKSIDTSVAKLHNNLTNLASNNNQTNSSNTEMISQSAKINEMKDQWKNESKKERIETHQHVVQIENKFQSLKDSLKLEKIPTTASSSALSVVPEPISTKKESSQINQSTNNQTTTESLQENDKIQENSIPPPPPPPTQIKEQSSESLILAEQIFQQFQSLITMRLKPLFNRIRMYEQFMGEISNQTGQDCRKLEFLYQKRIQNVKQVEQRARILNTQNKKLKLQCQDYRKHNIQLNETIDDNRLLAHKFDTLRLNKIKLKQKYDQLKNDHKDMEKEDSRFKELLQDFGKKSEKDKKRIQTMKEAIKVLKHKVQALTFRSCPDFDEEVFLYQELTKEKQHNSELKRALNYYYND